MTSRQGPSKKLAPTIRPEAGCAHTYSEDEGLQLDIDCSECKGAHDLGNGKCLSAVLTVLSEGARPEAIVLKRFMHKRYRGEMVRIATIAASDLATLNRAILSVHRPSDRRCRTCPASRERWLVATRQCLLDDPVNYVADPPAVSEKLKQGMARIECPKAAECLEEIVNVAQNRTEAGR